VLRAFVKDCGPFCRALDRFGALVRGESLRLYEAGLPPNASTTMLVNSSNRRKLLAESLSGCARFVIIPSLRHCGQPLVVLR